MNVHNTSRSFSLDETEQARQMSNTSCSQKFDETKQVRLRR